MQLVKPLPFEEAVDKLGSRSNIGSQLSSSEWADVPVALRERAFFSSRVESARVLQRARDGIADFLQSNRETLPHGESVLKTGSRADFVKQMQDFLKGEGIERSSGGLTDIAGERRLGLIFDTQTRQANDYGNYRQGMDADLLNEFPAQRFIRVEDVNEPRTSHTDFEDQVYLKTDPIWSTINDDFGVPWGPWGWGCGHDVEDVDRTEAEELGLVSSGQEVTPDDRSFNENLKASTKGLDPDLLAKLKEDFGDKITITGDTMHWRGQEPATKPEPTKPPAAPANNLPSPPRSGGGTEGEVSSSPVRTSPVSQSLDVKVRGTLKNQVLTAVRAIDKVHDDGKLPTIPVNALRGKRALGCLSMERRNGQIVADKISVQTHGRWPALTAVHEVGHLLDLEAIGAKGIFTSNGNTLPAMTKVIDTARESAAVKQLADTRANSSSMRERRYNDYMLQSEEIWARAYAQFIAERSGDPILLEQLKGSVELGQGRQWTTEDFKPVAAAIETLFKELKWL